VDILSTFCVVFMVQCVNTAYKFLNFRFLLFDCFVYCENVTCLKCFTRYGHYAGDVEDIIIARLVVVS